MNGIYLQKCKDAGETRKTVDLFKKQKFQLAFLILTSILFSAHMLAAQDPALTAIEATPLSYDEGQAPTPVSETITVSDPDSPILTSATIRITGNYSATEDVLEFADAFSIAGSYDPLTGTLTLTGPASPADFTNALRSVLYKNTNEDNPSDLLRTVSFFVDDGSINSATVSRQIQVNRVNDPPVGQDDSFVMYEDTELDCGCILSNDTDPDGDDLIALHGRLPENGTIYDLGGFFIYTPNPDFFGTDSFTYYANDGTENSNETTVYITVLPVNDAPIAFDDAISTDEDTPIDIPVLSNDIDVDDVLVGSMIVIVNAPTQGTVTINTATGAVEYVPNLNYNGNDSFTYQVKDASDALSNVATVSIVINPVNDAPIANPDLASTNQEVPVSIPVLANDIDVDNTLDGSGLIVVNGPANGTAVVEPASGTILYTPNEDFTGNDSFTYQVTDPAGATSNPATVNITVLPVNTRPVAVDDQATTDENVAVDINILENDHDADNNIVVSSVVIATDPVHGAVTVHSSGLVTYSPEADFAGNDSFTYTIQDAEGLVSLPATVSVSVLAAENKPPTAVDDHVVNTSLSAIIIDVLANDYDEDDSHDKLVLVSVTDPAMGTVSIVDGKVIYKPSGMNSGTVTFSYTIRDPSGLTDEAIVTVENSFLPLIVSEGFSPNNDNNNDTWYIQGIEYYPDNFVKVYDRWGFLVYQKQHYDNNSSPWDGHGNAAQHSGKLLDQGTYYYILEPGSEMKTMNGYVVIVR